ncbi:MAG: hypothetical protein QOH80_1621, partial [Actinomycetota bacterium]|nr:hypothetical protein [Actinomycetota bacterium]
MKGGALRRPRVRTLLWVVAALLIALVGGLAGLDATGHLAGGVFADPTARPSPTPTPSTPPPPAGPVLAAATSTASAPSPSDLDPLLADPDLGGDPGAFVVDVGTGQVLVDRDGSGPRTPASVAKLATAAAALVAVGPRTRLTTRTVAGTRPGEVVLVGA